MSVDYLDLLILDCSRAFQRERSKNAIYHLLKGKKSSQTIQDGKLFSLDKYRGIVPAIPKKEFHERLLKLEGAHLLVYQEPVDSFGLSPQGLETLEAGFDKKPWPPYLHGARYHSAARVFWSRLSLLIQAVSNYLAGRRSYLPISSDPKVREWVKNYLKSQKRLTQFADNLHKELEGRLLQCREKEAELFVYSLTSSSRIGWTLRQLANRYGEDYWYMYVLFWNVIHYLIQTASNGETPSLSGLVSDYPIHVYLTASSRKTLLMLKQGITVPEIAAARNLKNATIEDHIVEIAMHDPFFSISPFISERDLHRITGHAEELGTNKLKQIYEGLEGKFSYFQIRLALTQKVNQNG
jgi:uncharacterized protein YpbB